MVGNYCGQGRTAVYTDLVTPQAQDYNNAYRALSTVIDEMRGVYRNIGEDQQYVGTFPYEPLHDMRRAMEQLGNGKPTADRRREAREKIDQAWDAMRYDFLSEFETPEPLRPISKRDSKRIQRPGSKPRRRWWRRG